MKLRLHGTPAECATTAERLRRTPGLHITGQSRPYLDRTGELVRVYLTVDLDPRQRPARRPRHRWGREAAVSGCFECDIDHHLACPFLGEEDDGFDADEDGWYAVHCCCGLAVDSRQTLDAEYAEELRRRGWSQPADPNLDPGRRG
jgi:hypothetical protein